jgi:2-methylisocitrate lyase-like PEP mutase family enzyme
MSNERLDLFRSLHAGPAVLVLANAWDAASARLIESLGARACATTSAGVAWSLGYPDGDAAPVGEVIALVGRIARAIRVPLSVDIEGGYATDPAKVESLVRALVDLGVVGVNLEDGGGEPALLAAKIEAIKKAARAAGADVFVNARTDVYLRGLAAPGGLVAETVARASRYRAAGADGIFVPGLKDAAAIREIAGAVALPLNVMAVPGLPAGSELAALGVRRLSAGSGIAQSVWSRVESLTTAFLATGRSEPLSADAKPYGEVQQLFAR